MSDIMLMLSPKCPRDTRQYSSIPFITIMALFITLNAPVANTGDEWVELTTWEKWRPHGEATKSQLYGQ
jgi:hypothetical protein